MFPDLTRDDVFRLETRRLWLRWPRLADAQAVVRLAGEKAVAEMTSAIPHPYPPDEAERYVFNIRKRNADGDGLVMAITPKGKPNALIGTIGLAPNAEGRPSLGYWLGVPYWGQGYVTEAARAMIDALFTLTEEQEVTASARVINPASRRVLEKCGFAFQGSGLMEFKERGGVFPTDFFRLDRRTWQSLKAWGHSGYVQFSQGEAAPPALATAAE